MEQMPPFAWSLVLLCLAVAVFYRNRHKDDDDKRNNDRKR